MDVVKAGEILNELMKEGGTFNYHNFSLKGAFGYPETYTPKYTSWYLRTDRAIKNIFGESSAVFKAFNKSREISVLGNAQDKFNDSHGRVMGALQAAIDMNSEESMFVDQKQKNLSNKVFIVHGHDEALKNQLEIFLKEIGLEPIVLHRQADEGKTIIEKFEKHSEVGYAFILLTPDDIGYNSTEETKDEKDKKKNLRARQNVIFEFGYFVGKLGRSRVCCIHKADLELPTDIAGMIYKQIIVNLEEAAFAIIKDLKAAGYFLPGV